MSALALWADQVESQSALCIRLDVDLPLFCRRADAVTLALQGKPHAAITREDLRSTIRDSLAILHAVELAKACIQLRGTAGRIRLLARDS